MFWIGLIVGIIVAVVAYLAFVAWAFYVTKVDYVEYCDMRDSITTALLHRESAITVVHDDEVLSTVTLKEK